jgi:hypothetical protein
VEQINPIVAEMPMLTNNAERWQAMIALLQLANGRAQTRGRWSTGRLNISTSTPVTPL